MQGDSSSDCKALVNLLSPQGRLMQAIQSADADALIQFKFPVERLPSYTQVLLGSQAGRWLPTVAADWTQQHLCLQTPSRAAQLLTANKAHTPLWMCGHM